MANLKSSLIAATLLALCNSATATAQVHMPQATTQIAHKMPGAEELPVLKTQKMRFNPAQLHRFGGRLDAVSRQEGDFYFRYDGTRITHESSLGSLEGRYSYDRSGRFDRIDYNDGTSITAVYGTNNELIGLKASSGRTIAFQYIEENNSPSNVTPTENSLEFHSAVAVLRMQRLPLWMRTSQEQIRLDENPDPSTPAGTIVVTGSREPTGVDLIPIGGPGPYRSGGGDLPRPEDVKDLIDLYRRERLIASCLSGCEGTYRIIERGCATGPTFSQRMECMDKAIEFQARCDIACNTGDYTHEWQGKRPPPDYFPWKRK